MEQNEALFDLIEYTNRSIFLTGKAGTGKTTFLNNFVKKTQKKHIIIAPTGIAAINAGGVTIHSMFGLPLRTFIPTTERIDQNIANNIADLMPHFKYRKDKLKLLREVEVIIIDEVSMLRADVLDMMDFALRHIRRNPLKFGGVQMLFIGDLYQLPPVVRDEYLLNQYYKSPFFFHAKALEDYPIITIELRKVYRQTDEKFLKILNAIRNGDVENIDFNELNSRYDPDFEAAEEAYVYLCSHNRQADEINQRKLKELGNSSHYFDAEIIGDFKESQYPNEETLELKVGSQIMFIRNDTSPDKRYYNGKLAEITYINGNEISVVMEGSEEEFVIKPEIWEQKRYGLDAEKNITEEVLGSFKQYPIRLAWAVTIHKSQGLTFDRLIIDAGKSFASGQVYVALSRCRTLEGIVLKSRITPEVIFKDHRVAEFQSTTNANDRVEAILEAEKYDYSIEKVIRRLDCTWFAQTLEIWYNSGKDSRYLDREQKKNLYLTLKPEINNLQHIFVKFEKILKQLTYKFINQENDWQQVEEKAKGAVNFFFTNVNDKIFVPLKDFYGTTKAVKGLKAYNEDFKIWIDDLQDYLKDIKDAKLLSVALFDKKNDVEVSATIKKIPTHIISFQMFQDGKTLGEIAKERGLVVSTVYGHLAKFAEQGVLDKKDLLRIYPKEKIGSFEKAFKENPQETLNDWKAVLPSDFEYNEIRLLWNFFLNLNREK
ncbi:helix-turn-helix domain-containing protein [Soonwooa sp.]|uniref:helix-turn-helix domain-containing protein n=1 Tax=Soonwooa sp. TaxID=1938592 RepID=UPI0028B2120C|nr:helix-turn-helix domain-containing protein [Soonwooa sp.]